MDFIILSQYFTLYFYSEWNSDIITLIIDYRLTWVLWIAVYQINKLLGNTYAKSLPQLCYFHSIFLESVHFWQFTNSVTLDPWPAYNTIIKSCLSWISD